MEHATNQAEAIDALNEQREKEADNFNVAWANAPHYAKKRLLKKMDKRIYRPLEYSPAAGTRPAGLYASPRSPKDLEQAVSNFVAIYGGKTKDE